MVALRTLLTQYTERLCRARVDSPRLSAELLLAYGMGIPRAELLKNLVMDPCAAVAPGVAERTDACIARREAGEPVAYITGVKEFYGRDFSVTPATLIPRPDTETLVEAALAFARENSRIQKAFIDLGTGSGAIAVTLALELPLWRGVAVDISRAALRVAERNAATLGAANLSFAQSDFLGPDLPPGPYGMVLANPPYLSEEEYRAVSREVAGFEPKSALVPLEGTAAGLEHLFAILLAAPRLLVPGGLLLLEMGWTQGDALTRQAHASSAWTGIRILRDLAGRQRVFSAVRAG